MTYCDGILGKREDNTSFYGDFAEISRWQNPRQDSKVGNLQRRDHEKLEAAPRRAA